MTDTLSPTPPETRTSAAGLTVLIVLMLGVAAWMYTQRTTAAPSADTSTSVPATARPSELTGFRPDAWFLPDDDLLGFVEIASGSFLMGGDPRPTRRLSRTSAGPAQWPGARSICRRFTSAATR